MSKRADQKAIEAFPDIPLPNLGKDIVAKRGNLRRAYIHGYEQAEQDIISLIESRISEILGDAQPAPVLRIELRELITKIKGQ